jgi:PEP-CTERM motif
MNDKSLSLGFLVVALTLVPVASAHATTLTFDITNGAGGPTPARNTTMTVFQTYGDNVVSTSALGPGWTYGYDLAGGITPNVEVTYSPNVVFYDTNFGDLVNVVYNDVTIELTADPGFLVELNSLDLAGWPMTDRTITSLTVTDGTNTLYSLGSTAVAGAGPSHSHFDFGGTPLVGETLFLSYAGSNDVGIDNVNFSQSAVPEPSSSLLLVIGVLGLVAGKRSRNA